jgi:PAS domain-containing protein
VSMLLATAVLVHLSGGVIEMHFHFFVIVAAVTLYQQWAPFLSAIAFVTLHHGVLGTTAPEATYNHPAAIDDPWLWAAIHGGFIALASIVGLAAWRFDELVRDELQQVGEHHRVVLDSVGDAVLALDDGGCILTSNARAAAVLGGDGIPLTGRHVHDVVHPGARHPTTACPLAGHGQAEGTEEVRRVPRAAGTTSGTPTEPAGAVTVTPVTYRFAPVDGDSPVAAVLTLTDISEARRARVAERELRHLSAERLVERAEVGQLVASVSPVPLDVPGVALAACYVPASGALLGGDLYDWFRSPDGTVTVAVIDAMGKGRSATKHAVAVLHALRVLALAGHPLDELLGRATAVMHDYDDDLMATAIVARYRPGTGDLHVASAGHPPALVVRRDGACELLETVGLGFGVPGPGSSVLRTTTLDVGDTLVLYSDGLIEGTRDLDRGLADLQRAAATLVAEPPARMVERLVCEPASVAADDDRVALALRRVPPG